MSSKSNLNQNLVSSNRAFQTSKQNPDPKKNFIISSSKTLYQQIGIKKSVTDMISSGLITKTEIQQPLKPSITSQSNHTKAKSQNYNSPLKKEQQKSIPKTQATTNSQVKQNTIQKIQIEEPKTKYVVPLYLFIEELIKTQDIDSYSESNEQREQWSYHVQLEQMLSIKFEKDFNNIQKIGIGCTGRINQIREVIKKCRNLKAITIFKNNEAINFEELSTFFEFLSTFSNITDLQLKFSKNTLLNDNVIQLGKALSFGKHFKTISFDLIHCEIKNRGIENFLNGIENCQNLQKLQLDLRYNEFSQESLFGLGSNIAKCTNLIELELKFQQIYINSEVASQLGENISQCTQLKCLYIEMILGKINDQDQIENFIVEISKCKNLIDLSLDFSLNGIEDVSKIGESLLLCQSLQSLYLQFLDTISLNSYLSLCKSLGELKKLRSLTLFIVGEEINDQFIVVSRFIQRKMLRLVDFCHDRFDYYYQNLKNQQFEEQEYEVDYQDDFE